MRPNIVTCLSYHHFEKRLSPFTRHLEISTSPDVFSRQLAYIKRRYSPISFDQLLTGDLPLSVTCEEPREVDHWHARCGRVHQGALAAILCTKVNVAISALSI